MIPKLRVKSIVAQEETREWASLYPSYLKLQVLKVWVCAQNID